jgi:hypothetical protein
MAQTSATDEPRAAAGVLDDHLARPQAAVGLGCLDHRQRHPVLVRAGGFPRPPSSPDLGLAVVSDSLQPDDRCVADRG